jgi:glycosyltransferase involved in cell wall biosynthesis
MVPSSGIEDVAVLDRDRMTRNVSLTTSPTLSIIIPTLNERDNIEPLVALLTSALAEIAREAIFVDDGSRDGTSDHVRALARANPRIRCLQRIGRRGLATACIEGVLASASPFVAVMDADLQHDERLLPDMLQPLESGTADLVVGTSSKQRSTIARQKLCSCRSPMTKSSASISENSLNFKSTPRTRKPSRFSRLTRWSPINPPAPQTNAHFTVHHSIVVAICILRINIGVAGMRRS